MDGVSRGVIKAGKPIPLEVGTHRVRYSAPGFTDSSDKPVTIALNAVSSDTFNLEKLAPPPPDVANLIVTTNPGAHLSVDGGQHSASDRPDGNGSYTFVGLPPGKHSIPASLDGFVALPAKEVELRKGEIFSFECVDVAGGSDGGFLQGRPELD